MGIEINRRIVPKFCWRQQKNYDVILMTSCKWRPNHFGKPQIDQITQILDD